MRAVRIRIAHALHYPKVSLVVERLEPLEFGVQSEMVVQSQGLSAGDRDGRSGTEVGIIRKRHESVESIVASRKLKHDENRAVLTRGGLNGGVRSHGIQRKKCALQKGGNRP